MTKGELISACIKIMYDNDGQVDSSSVSNNQDYSDRTSSIIESINRALDRLNVMNKLPRGIIEINKDTLFKNQNSSFTTYDLSELTEGKLLRIYHIDKFGSSYENDIAYRKNGRTTYILPTLEDEDNYIVKFTMKVNYLTYETSDEETIKDLDNIDIPNNVLNTIPYFVKADLYEEDNPSLASFSRNLFESYAEALPDDDDDFHNEVGNVYGV